jgi:hypothetical protein
MLYSEGLRGKEEEFASYRVLYALVTKGDVQKELRSMSPHMYMHPYLKHALQVEPSVNINIFLNNADVGRPSFERHQEANRECVCVTT